MSPNDPTESTRRSIADAAAGLPMADEQDFEDATRGFIARGEQRQVTADDGRVVWDLDAYAFLDDEVPDTANPGLWRQGQLLNEDGLYEVVPGVYQLRGYDLSVMSVIEGESGVIVVDPLTCRETAAAAFALYAEHRGERPVLAVIYTHTHIDHFGGVKGVVDAADVAAGRVEVIAPEGFMDHTVSENVFAGTAMGRRAAYMFGAALEKGPAGQIGSGLGLTVPTGEPTLIPPTREITETGERLTLDGIEFVFQMTPGTEAPAEMNFYLPALRAACTAENTSHTLHNILTLRGAEVRDARAWADYLTETIDLWGDELEVVFASHHWPTWGRERAVGFLRLQREVYGYIHDQTLRMINQGYVGEEIAEMLELPPALEAAWHVRGYYGSVSHNVKAIYQRYMGWYDANPAHLWGHPPVEVAERYVAAMGGPEAAVEIAQRAFEEGDYRWAVEVLNHVLFADESHEAARGLQADAMEQIGWGSENGTWRNVYLSGAHELRHGSFGTPTAANPTDILRALTVKQIFAGIGIRIDGPRAWDEHLVISWVLTDEGTTHVIEVSNGSLSQRVTDAPAPDSTTIRLDRLTLIGLVTGGIDLGAALEDGSVKIDGDPTDLGRLVSILAPFDPDFAIVTP